MDGESYLRFILALLLVLGLLALAAYLLRRSGLTPKLSRGRRLGLVESLPLGPRHRLMLIRRDEVEHLLLLGPQGDVVVESRISASSPQPFADMLDERARTVSTAAAAPHHSSLDEPN